MKKIEKTTIAAAIHAVLIGTPGVAVQAQVASSSADLQEITVQAEKYRPEDQTSATGLRLPLIDTPQSISVVSEEELKLFNATSMYQAAEMVPGVSQGGEGYGRQALLIRGQPNQQPRLNGMQSDEAQFIDSFALERIEFVRGPATVLYGVTGAFGGEMNQILKRPEADFHANFGFEGGDFANHRYEGDVTGSVPGTDDRLKVRLVGAYRDYGIFQDTVDPAHNLDRVLSGAISYDITTTTTVSLYGYGEDKNFDSTDGCPEAQGPNNTLYIPKSIPVTQYYCNDPYTKYIDFHNQFFEGSLNQTFANDWQMQFNIAKSSKFYPQTYGFSYGPAGSGGLPAGDATLYAYSYRANLNVVTSNLSLGGKFDLFDRTHQFFAALEYEKQLGHVYNYETFSLGTFNIFEDGGKGILADGSPIPPFPTSPPYVGDHINYEKDLRGSLQLLLNPFYRLDVLVGALLQKTDLSDSNVRPSKPTVVGGFNETNTVGRVGATYGLLANKGELLTDAKVYVSWSQGFLPNVGVYDALGNPLTAPQKSTSDEIGLKTEWFSNRVDATIAVYHATVSNIPALVLQAVGTSGGTFSSILGGLNTYNGVEIEVLGELTKGWNVSFSETYIRALTESPLIPQKLAVHDVPKNQISLFSSYEFLSGPLKGLILGGSIVNKIDVPLIDNAPAFVSGGYDPNNQLLTNNTKVDLLGSYKFGGSLKGLNVFTNVHNIFNVRSYYSLSGTPAFSTTTGPPRAMTVGIRYVF